jgi:hypothetical protein
VGLPDQGARPAFVLWYNNRSAAIYLATDLPEKERDI